jgi:sortase A
MGVVGELLITFGVIVLLFLAWQLWINNAVVKGQQQAASSSLTKEWADAEDFTATALPEEDFGPAPAFGGAAAGAQFATIYIPRLGADSTRVVKNGVELPTVLNHGYFGHYPDTQWPGQPGNFALAVHRTNWGSPFGDAPQFQLGDKIYVETEDGYYTYVFRNYEFVLPTAVDVLLPVPGTNQSPGEQSIITITTCNPLLGDAERMIVYGVLDSWRPRSAGPPAEMAKTQKVNS